MRVFIGHDSREATAYRVCCTSMTEHAPKACVAPISRCNLGKMYQRPTSVRGGVLWDEISDAPMSTDFSLARFWTPLLSDSGWTVFCDGDFLWRDSVFNLLRYADPRYAVMVVKHHYTPGERVKMDGQPQTSYQRKNWSSLMLFNCDRVARDSQLLNMLNTARGIELHQFSWVDDSLIGELPLEWNWLEGVSSRAVDPKAVHFTRGTPDMKGYEDSAFADEWRAYALG